MPTAGKDRDPEAFVHKPLDTAVAVIRVIKILPGSGSSPIHCELQHVTLSRDHACLSYVWGDRPASRGILLNGKRFLVRQNVWDYLWQARENGECDFKWIDAICIDQANTKERNHQVGLMSKIYRQSRLTTVWLGMGDLEILRLLVAVQSSHSDDGLAYLDFHDSCWWSAFRNFANLNYWARLWVIQEIILSPQCIFRYGPVQIPIENLRVLLATAPVDVVDMHSLYSLLELRNQHSKARTGLPFFQVLNTNRNRHCEAAFDRVFGVLGVVQGGENFGVDYEEPVEDLFIRTAIHFTPESKNDLLHNAIVLAVVFRPWGLRRSLLDSRLSTLQHQNVLSREECSIFSSPLLYI